MNDNNNISLSYESLWKFIIRPPRDNYSLDELGYPNFVYKSKNYYRKDLELISSQGYKMKCSLIEPEPKSRPSKMMPIVIYLHGNASSRLEGLRSLEILLPHGINLFLVDLPGSGLSEGEYISLGYYESHDLGIIIDFLENYPGVGKIGVWGRSMGAVTTLIYSHKDPRIKALCIDSPFANFCRLSKELTTKYINIPEFILNGILSILRGTIISKNGLDIYKLNPIEKASITYQPAMFIHAIKDELINLQHAIDIFNIYGGEKSLKCSEIGGHNSKRPKRITKEVGNFFEKYLSNDKNEFQFNSKNEISSGEEDEGLYDIKNVNSFSQESELNIREEKYISQKEKEEKQSLDEIKSILSSINPNEINSERVNINNLYFKKIIK